MSGDHAPTFPSSPSLLIEFAMKLQDNLISKQAESINDNKEFWEKVNLIEAKFDDLKKENETL